MVQTISWLANRKLQPHPQAVCDAVEEVAVDIGVGPGEVLVVDYRIVGNLEALRIPACDDRLDPQRLWEHTCCELFAAPEDDDAYVEWNFSPTGQVATFSFESYRQRGPASHMPPAQAEAVVHAGALWIRARVPMEHALGLRLSLTAVIEDGGGTLSYWALRHPAERPDFHHRGGFSLALTWRPSPAIVDVSSGAP